MTEKEFGCDNCGYKLIAISPDDSYVNFFMKPCCEKSIERKIECENCDFRNSRFWCIRHTVVVSKGIDVDRELDRRFDLQ